MHYSSDHGMKVVRISARSQIAAAFLVLCVAVYSLTMTGVALAGTSSPTAEGGTTAEMQRLQQELASLKNDVAMKAASLEAKQSFIEKVISGEASMDDLERAAPLLDGDEVSAAGVLAPLAPVEARQEKLLEYASIAAESHIQARHDRLETLGLSPDRYARETGMGGPEVSIGEDLREAAEANPRFAALLTSWGRLDYLDDEMKTLPHVLPVSEFRFTSEYGRRVDPFRRRAAMHQGLDMAAPHGTAIRSSAPGKVVKAGWAGGYGKMVEIDHGNGITSRYAHMSRILVSPGDRVSAGESIGKMGSTGRSTGSHLHFEIRVDGRAVDPMPYFEQPVLAAHDDGGAQGGQ
ncbi:MULTISPECIES: M23 family metallopeptidase [Pacificimonas]|nr:MULTISPECIES: M23 family metallopeptidase [Pacificimonas]MBZ6378321.1 M23 family metallopeptidase [Pacificimonas aurantium]